MTHETPGGGHRGLGKATTTAKTEPSSSPPKLSDLATRVLADAADRDAEIACTTGYPDYWSAVAYLETLDAEQRESVALDGLRWRHWASLTEVARRYEQSRRDERRLAAEDEHTLREAFRRLPGDRYAPGELQRQRRTPGGRAWRQRHGDYRGGPVSWGGADG